MKITTEHFNTLAEAIAPHDTEWRREQYRTGSFPRAALVNDLNKRYRWDLYWTAKECAGYDGSETWPSGYADAHIDTALRTIIPAL
jgi:hypothetical protein